MNPTHRRTDPADCFESNRPHPAPTRRSTALGPALAILAALAVPGTLRGQDCNSNGIPDADELQGTHAALDFDGADDYVRIPRSAVIEPRNEMTFEAWVRPDTVGSSNAMVCRYSASFGAGYIVAWQWSSGGRIQVRIDGATSGSLIIQDTTPTSSYNGQWQHVAFTYSVSANSVKLFVNGVQKASAAALGALNYSNADLFIGNSLLGSGDDFDGRIDELRIWNVARTQAQINTDRVRRLVGNEPGLVGYWRFDAGSGQVVADATANGVNGTLGGSSAVEAVDPAWVVGGAPLFMNDCNGNGILDVCDIAAASSQDCNSNGLPDECEVGGLADCNSNGVKDLCDLFLGTAQDCNTNNIPDTCDIAAGAMDLDVNGVPDACVFPLVYERVKPCSRVFLVPDDAIDGVRVRNRSGAAVSTLLPGQLDYVGGGISLDPAGNLLVTEWNRDRIAVISRSGTLVRTITGGGLDGPHSATMTPAGTIAVCSYLTDSIKFFTVTGDYLSNLSHANGTQDPQCLAYDRSGNLYVGCRNNGTGHVAKFNPQLQFVTYIGQGTFAPHPLDMAFDSGQNLYVTTPGMIRKFNPAGTLIQTITAVNLDPKGIAIDESGRLWVTNNTTRTIFRFNSAGAYLDTIDIDLGLPGSGPPTLYGIALDVKPDGDCNSNGTGDACDIDAGATDCDGDGILDSCQVSGNDCNSNGVLDRCESGDCNSNGVRDVCDILAGATDCNSNGLPDSCELSGPLSVPGATVSPINGRRYLLSAPLTWTNAEAVAVSLGGHLATVRSAAENQWLLNFVLANSSADRAWIGFNDVATEGYFVWTSGEPAIYTNWYPGEPNNSGNEDWVEMLCRVATPGTWNDSPGNLNQPGIMEFPPLSDCNSNGVLDSCDIASGSSGDCDTNGVPDDCQPNTDCNNNGVRDLCEAGGMVDCDGDGVTNFCQIAGGAPDCNGNWIPDNCDSGVGDFALSFDGSNDIVRVPRSVTLEPANELTVECWVKPRSVGQSNARILRMAVGRGFILAWEQSGDQRVQLRIDGATSGSVAAVDTVPTTTYLGGWHHIAGVYSATGNYTRLFVDGVLKDSKAGMGPMVYSNADLHIGNSIYGSEAFDGTIDELRIWTVARTQAQIAGDRFKTYIGPRPGLVGYWKMDAGTGQLVADASGLGNNGQLGNDSLPGGDSGDPAWASGASGAGGPADCNGNGVPDACEVAAHTVSDCNSNGVPDACEPDCNSNGVADACDISAGTTPDCNSNGVPDSCDIAFGTSTDVNSNGVPDSCEPDIRLIPVISIVDPAGTSELRNIEPASLPAVSRGSRYYIELWASDVGPTNTGLTGVYADVNFCSQTTASELFSGSIFTVFPSGVIQAGKVDEFGGSALPNGGGVAPQWVRVGWIQMNAVNEAPACTVSLTAAVGGVAAFSRGLIDPALIQFGSTTVTITPPARTYDLDNNGVINVGDLSLFAGSWLMTVPPGQAAHDFDCTGEVGVGDLSWFATGWLKNVNDPTILFPPCSPASLAASPGEGNLDVPQIDLAFRLAVLATPSTGDTRSSVPTSLTSITEGQDYYVEIWGSDIGDVNTGITSAYFDLMLPATGAFVVNINHNSIFNVFPAGSIQPDRIDELGGSCLTAGRGVAPLWVRVATVRFLADAQRTVYPFALAPSTTGCAAYGRGSVTWPGVELTGASIGTPGAGDLDGDGDVDNADLQLFVQVLLGRDLDPVRRARSDMNADTQANGLDIAGFVNALMGA
ncbi:MAG: LamG-like jellyroll fold domain-containing protein [Phycisphaerae bacterium]